MRLNDTNIYYRVMPILGRWEEILNDVHGVHKNLITIS